MNLQLIKGYKNNKQFRVSFNKLATQTFGIHFEDWFRKGFWTDKYVPYSYVDCEKVIANVSVNHLELVVNNEVKKAIQIGTVMTHPDYRNEGLSGSLMNKVLEDYEGQYDVMYLIANNTVLDFYPKFGFKRVTEYQFSMDIDETNTIEPPCKLDGSDEKDLRFIYEFASKRVPVSPLFGTKNTTELLMFYCMYVFSQDIYYLEEERTIAIYKQEEAKLHIFDLISQNTIDTGAIINKLAGKETNKVVFHFTPDCAQEYNMTKQVFTGSEVLFVRIKDEFALPMILKHPLTSQA